MDDGSHAMLPDQGQRATQRPYRRYTPRAWPPYEQRRPVMQWLHGDNSSLVLGEPGHGKSMLLRFLALSILQPDESSSAPPPAYLRLLPVWIPFAGFATAVERTTHASVEDFFCDWLHQHSFDDVTVLFRRALSGGQVLLLLDGLDEAATVPAGNVALDRVVTFLESREGRIIATGRPRACRNLPVPTSWRTASLTPFSDDQILALATRWFRIIEASPNESPPFDSKEPAPSGRATSYLHAVRENPRTLELARNPLLCQALIEIYRFSHRLPEARVTAYRQIIELLLSRHPAARAQARGDAQPSGRPEPHLSANDLEDVLCRLAWQLQVHQHGGYLNRSDCERTCSEYLEDETAGLGLRPADARRRAAEVVDQLLLHYGVLVEPAPGQVCFLHLSIQEYLVAELLARRSRADQLTWLSENWLNPSWREVIVCWFGILGARGERSASVQAAKRLAQLGKRSEWERISSLEFRIELATADLRFPVGEARKLVREATREAQISPFPQFRTNLARCIATGALGSSVSSECRAAVRGWVPGRRNYARGALLQAFRSWRATAELEDTLLRAMHDEDASCRKAAAETFGHLYGRSRRALRLLREGAMGHVLPEARAAALHALASRQAWTDDATRAATANVATNSAELLLVVGRILIREGMHDRRLLKRLVHLWEADALDFGLRDNLTDLLCTGWPNDSKLRSFFLRVVGPRLRWPHRDLPFEYLVRCYPNDDEVADAVAALFDEVGLHMSMGDARLWPALQAGYRGNRTVCRALRTALTEYRGRHEAIVWHPTIVPAFVVLGDDQERDELLASYRDAAQCRDRYWIASALLEGWPRDDVFLTHVRQWATGPLELAAPLAEWGAILAPDRDKREAWLGELAAGTLATREVRALVKLLGDFPNEATRQIAGAFLEEPSIWYYNRVHLQGLFAKAFPEDSRSADIVRRSLEELDGPDPGTFAGSFQGNSVVAGKLMAAATAAPVDVRMAVATTLRSRFASYERVVELTGDVLAEESGAVRTNCLIARGQAARGRGEDAEEVVALLAPELTAAGPYGQSRNLSAMAGLIEVGQFQKVAAAASKKGGISLGWTLAGLDEDVAGVTVIVENWDQLQDALDSNSGNLDLPVPEALRVGGAPLLERTEGGRRALDRYLEARVPDAGHITVSYLEAAGRRLAGTDLLRIRLVEMLGERRTGRDIDCTVARIFAATCAGSADPWLELKVHPGTAWGRLIGESVQGTRQDYSRALVPGVLGYLVLGWPDGTVAAYAKSASGDRRSGWTPRDRLLVAVALKQWSAAERAARDILSDVRGPWRYRLEDTQALRVWGRASGSAGALLAWIDSSDPSLSLTALSLARSEQVGEIDVRRLLARFNSQAALAKVAPVDGVDAATGRHTGWAVGAYASLRAGLGF